VACPSDRLAKTGDLKKAFILAFHQDAIALLMAKSWGMERQTAEKACAVLLDPITGLYRDPTQRPSLTKASWGQQLSDKPALPMSKRV
jgi:hypothetical protein